MLRLATRSRRRGAGCGRQKHRLSSGKLQRGRGASPEVAASNPRSPSWSGRSSPTKAAAQLGKKNEIVHSARRSRQCATVAVCHAHIVTIFLSGRSNWSKPNGASQIGMNWKILVRLQDPLPAAVVQKGLMIIFGLGPCRFAAHCVDQPGQQGSVVPSPCANKV